ncbi:MAG: ATP-binding protein, partial [Verrucomicrobiales bacterium]
MDRNEVASRGGDSGELLDFWLSGGMALGQDGAVIEDRIPWFASASVRRRYLVGVSGGADSVALLHLLHRQGFRRLVVCHLNHGLRGGASAGDARFVRGLAKRLGYDFEEGREAVGARAVEMGCSL